MCARIIELLCLSGNTIRQALHRIIRSLEDVRRRDLPLRIGLSDKRLEVGIGRHSDRVDRFTERAEVLHDGYRHVRRVSELLQIGVDESRRKLLRLLTNMPHGSPRLDVVLHRGVVVLLDSLDLFHRRVGPRINLIAGFTREALVGAHVVRDVIGLVQAAHDRVVLIVRGIECGGALNGGDQAHESVVHGAINHDDSSLSQTSDGAFCVGLVPAPELLLPALGVVAPLAFPDCVVPPPAICEGACVAGDEGEPAGCGSIEARIRASSSALPCSAASKALTAVSTSPSNFWKRTFWLETTSFSVRRYVINERRIA